MADRLGRSGRKFQQLRHGLCSSPATIPHSEPKRITEVTFTPLPAGPTIQLWFGSSGGGLPRRPEQGSGRFLFAVAYEVAILVQVLARN